jgi:hypothetical protein
MGRSPPASPGRSSAVCAGAPAAARGGPSSAGPAVRDRPFSALSLARLTVCSAISSARAARSAASLALSSAASARCSAATARSSAAGPAPPPRPAGHRRSLHRPRAAPCRRNPRAGAAAPRAARGSGRLAARRRPEHGGSNAGTPPPRAHNGTAREPRARSDPCGGALPARGPSRGSCAGSGTRRPCSGGCRLRGQNAVEPASPAGSSPRWGAAPRRPGRSPTGGAAAGTAFQAAPRPR